MSNHMIRVEMPEDAEKCNYFLKNASCKRPNHRKETRVKLLNLRYIITETCMDYSVLCFHLLIFYRHDGAVEPNDIFCRIVTCIVINHELATQMITVI